MTRIAFSVDALHDFASAHRLAGEGDAGDVSVSVKLHAEILNAERAFDFGHAHFIREHVYVSVCHVDLHSVCSIEALGSRTRGVFLSGGLLFFCAEVAAIPMT